MFPWWSRREKKPSSNAFMSHWMISRIASARACQFTARQSNGAVPASPAATRRKRRAPTVEHGRLSMPSRNTIFVEQDRNCLMKSCRTSQRINKIRAPD